MEHEKDGGQKDAHHHRRAPHVQGATADRQHPPAQRSTGDGAPGIFFGPQPQLTTGDGGNQRPTTAADFANGGIKVGIPIPAETSLTTHSFYVIHVFSTDINGNAAGDYEMFSTIDGSATISGDLIHVKLNGCSPIAVFAVPNSGSSSAPAPAPTGSGITLYGPYFYENENKAMFTADRNGADADYEYGEPLYYLIVDDQTGSPLTEHKYVEKLKVSPKWTMNGNMVDSVSVVKKYIDVYGEGLGFECQDVINGNYWLDSDYYYFLEIVPKDKDSVSETDVQGVIEFDRKANKKENVKQIKDCKVDIDFELFYPNTWKNDGKIVDEKVNIEWDTEYALKFDSDDEVELSFGGFNGGDNEGTFTVDASGQGKVFLKYDTNPVESVTDANPEAKIYFVNFTGINGAEVKFNRVGEFVYEMEGAAAAYRIINGKLVPISNLTIDQDEFSFNTNTLGRFVFADRELA